MEVGGVNGGVIYFGLRFAGEATAAQVMQDTPVSFTEDAGLQKELLSKAHVAVSEYEREAVALDFIMNLYAIRCGDKRHAVPSFQIC
jgi:hypothetical protein